MAEFVGTSNRDVFVGLSTEDNVFFFTPDTLQPDDVVTGNSDPAFLDFLQFTAPGAVHADAFSGVSHVEWLVLADQGNDVTLSNTFLGGSDQGFTDVLGGSSGASTVDATTLAAGLTVYYYAQGAGDTYEGGADNDVFTIDGGKLNSTITFSGGGGGDWLHLQHGGTVSSSALAGISGIEVIQIENGGTVQLRNGIFGDSAYVLGTDADDTIDASGVTDRGIGFLSSGGHDTLIGGAQDDIFIVMGPAGLTSATTIDGGAGANSIDLFGGNYASDAMAHVSAVQTIILVLPSSVTLLDNISTTGLLVQGSSGDDTIDASSVTSFGIEFFSNGGLDTLIGGNATDAFVFNADLDHDTVVGGNGGTSDFLLLEANDTYTAADLANVTGIEEIQLLAGGSVAVADANVSTALGQHMTLRGSAAADTLDASQVLNAANSVELVSNGGADVLHGGAGNDIIDITDGNYAQVDGGGAFDILRLSTQNRSLDLTLAAGKTTGIEAVDTRTVVAGDALESTQITLSAAAVHAVTGGGDSLYLVAGDNDDLILDNGWVVAGHGETNPNLPGFAFDHLVDGSLNLFIFGTTTAFPEQAEVDLGGPAVENFTTGAYATGPSGIAIAATNATISDQGVALGQVQGVNLLTASIANAAAGSGEHLSLTSAGVSLASSLGLAVTTGTTLTISGVASLADYNALLLDIQYFDPDRTNAADLTSRIVNVSIVDTSGVNSDGSGHSHATIPIVLGNSAPVLDLNTSDGDFVTNSAAPAGFTTSFTSGSADVGLAGSVHVLDDHDALSQLVVDLHIAGGSNLNSGEAVALPTVYENNLTAAGFDIHQSVTATDYILTIDAPVGQSQTAAAFADIIDHVAYHNPVSDFSFNPDDRAISFALTDDAGASTAGQASVPLTTLHMAADVTDATGPVNFTGGDFDDKITVVNGGGTVDAGGGNDQIVFAASAGNETIDGGSGTNSFILNASASGNFVLSDSVGGLGLQTDSGTVSLANIQAITLNLSGGDGVDTSGVSSPIDITINTGAGGETIGLGAAHETLNFAGAFSDNTIFSFATGGADHIVVDVNDPGDLGAVSIGSTGTGSLISVDDGHGAIGTIELEGVAPASLHFGTELLLI